MSRALILLAGFCAAAHAGGPAFEIPWHTVDGGGGRSAGGSFQLSGTIGQHDAGPVLSSGAFSLRGGFWVRGSASGCNAADLAPPYGLLDLADVSAFIAAFLAMDPLGDLNNDGVFDLTDITDFVGAFSQGCP